MYKHHLVQLLALFLLACEVRSFTINSRHERSTDLAEALAILQRQRRRVGVDSLSSERLLGSLTLDDVNEWLASSRVSEGDPVENDIEPVWMSQGQFKDFEPRLRYDLPVDRASSAPTSVELSKKELEDIFSVDNEESNSSAPPAFDTLPEKKKKEEMVEVKGDKKIIQKKSVSSDTTNFLSEVTTTEDNSLDTLTKEEFKALMKAVGKLQKEASKLGEEAGATPSAKVTVVQALTEDPRSQELAIIQPANQEELKSVFEESAAPPIMTETDVIVETMPGSKAEKVVKEEIVSNVSPKEVEEIKETEQELTKAMVSELEEDISREAARAVELEEAEKQALLDELGAEKVAKIKEYWHTNRYLGSNPQEKRTAKRAVGFVPSPASELDGKSAEIDADIGDSLLKDLDVGVAFPTVEKFVAKILELQGEVDRLKVLSRLEDLENDVLTDALNEATLAQKEGTVSDMEFESLQQAISIEEALQELKKNINNKPFRPDVIKRGEPWRRKRIPDVLHEIDTIRETEAPSYSLPPFKPIGQGVTKEDIERLLAQSYLMREREEKEEAREEENEDEETTVASLFMRKAGECPAVQAYSTNCELADLYSLPVDYEARSLCNLHEMCYACGNSLHVSHEHCDFVYRAAATALCQEKEKCVLESEIFLRTMKLKTRYIPHPQPKCRSVCTAKFLGIL